jgi:hypothetical protein
MILDRNCWLGTGSVNKMRQLYSDALNFHTIWIVNEISSLLWFSGGNYPVASPLLKAVVRTRSMNSTPTL